jgi:hypothetical protein
VPHVDSEILALLALGEKAGTPEDDAHVRGCAHCAGELGRLTEVVAVGRRLGDADPLEQPPARVWARITAELSTAVEPDPSSGAAGEQTARQDGRAGHRSRRMSGWRRPVAVALAGLVIGAGAATAGWQLAGRPAGQAVVARIALRPLPQFPRWKDASGTALMERGPAGQLLTVTLRAPSQPGFYEVWLLARDGVSMISLGDLNASHAGQFAMPPGVNLAFYSRIDISLQPFNGSTLHSRTSVVRGSIP